MYYGVNHYRFIWRNDFIDDLLNCYVYYYEIDNSNQNKNSIHYHNAILNRIIRDCITNHLQHSRVIISPLNLRRTCPTHFSNIDNGYVAIHFARYKIMSKRVWY
jgi:hypothetical protein